MDALQLVQAVTDLVHGHFTPGAIVLIWTVLGVVGTFLAGYLKTSPKSKIIESIQAKMLVAEKYVDRTMYDDHGAYNQAKEDLAVNLLKSTGLKMDEAKLRELIKTLCSKVHEAVNA